MSGLRRSKTALRPRLLALEDRCCPACVVTQMGDTLSITGDGLDNRIDIVGLPAHSVRVACDGSAARTFTGVSRYVLNTGAGSDTVSTALGGTGDDRLGVTVGDSSLTSPRVLLSGDLSIGLDCGDGNDHAIVVNDRVATTGSVAGSISGGRGNDVMIQDANDFIGTLRTSLFGGAGGDNASIIIDDFTGTLDCSSDGG